MRKILAALLVLAASFAYAQVVTDPARTGIGGGGGSGTVTSVSVASANGLAGTVANPTTTPAITLSTSITGLLKGNGTAVAQAASGGDYVAPTTTVNGHALSANVTVTASDVGLGSVANVDTTNATNITSGALAAARGGAGATSGILKANGSGLVSAAVSGTDLKTINSTSIIGSGDIAISATPAGSGSEVQYRNAGAFGAVTGSSVSGSNVTLGGTMTVTQSIPASGTVTVSTPLILGTQLWNNGATTFDLDSLTATDTASASASTVFKRVVGSTTVASILKNGQFVSGLTAANSPSYSFAGDLTTGWGYRSGGIMSAIASAGEVLRISTAGADSLGSNIGASNGGKLALGTAGTFDTFFGRSAAGVFEVNDGTACSTVSHCRDIKVRHYLASGTAPTIGGSCGTSPSIAGSDSAAQVTVGTGSPTSCTVTFGTAFANAPVCAANGSGTAGVKVATTTTTVIVSATALTASEKLQVLCIGI